jgi:hypothetical protein
MMNDPSTEFGSFEGSDEQHGALFLEYKEQFVRQRHLLLLLRFKMVLPSKPEVILKRTTNVVPHRSTIQAKRCLTLQSGRDAVLSSLYGRSC